jgi:hypothetical protein
MFNIISTFITISTFQIILTIATICFNFTINSLTSSSLKINKEFKNENINENINNINNTIIINKDVKHNNEANMEVTRQLTEIIEKS